MDTLVKGPAHLCKQDCKRNIILASAANLFIKNGYHGTSIGDISKESQVDKASIYYYFRDKAFIAESLLNAVASFYEVNLLNLIHEPGNLRGHQLAVKFIDQINALIDHGHIWLIFTHDFDLDDLPSLNDLINNIIDRWTNAIRKLIKPIEYASLDEQITATASFELIIAAMRTKRRGKNTNHSGICLKRLLKSLWINHGI